MQLFENPNKEMPTVIILHRITEREPGNFEGILKLVDIETGELLEEIKPQRFSGCHIMYASYKTLISKLRFINWCGYEKILLDTNIQRFADEINSGACDETLQKRLKERCEIYGIKEIEVIE